MSETTELARPIDYQAARANVFPSEESLRWFVRQHRDELIAAGAIVAPAGRKLISPQAFDKAVLSIGARLLSARRKAVVRTG
jgi:hypothetical protein